MDETDTPADSSADSGAAPPTEPAPPRPSRRRRIQAAVLGGLKGSVPAFVIGLIALYLIWPVPKGEMPMSADHNVHVARAAMIYDKLASGHLSGWSSKWFFGFPAGELYPPGGDYAVALMRFISFGKFTFQECYAYVFAIAYVFQAVIMVRISRRAGMHPVAGMVAGFLLLYDSGVLREGGWRYTVYYGVWLQPLACALLWWALAEIYRSVQIPAAGAAWVRRAILPAVLLAIAMITHPIVLPTSAVMFTLFVLFVGTRSEVGIGPVAMRAGLALALGIGLSLWFIGPLFAHRHWMATFGTLYSDLGTMLGHVLEGHFAKRMPSGVGYGILIGLFWSWIRGNRFVRFVATSSFVLWMMSTSDFFWSLRLDWIHEGFLHMQYQRFIICAKPGLFLCGGFAVVGLVSGAWRVWEGNDRSRRAGTRMFIRFAVGTGICVWMLSAGYDAAKKHKVGEVQLKKLKDEKRADAFAKELEQFCRWSKQEWEDRDEFFRFVYRTRRHSHVYMDITLCNDAPAYKAGYMPGAVFVHRPEATKPEVLDHLRAKYIVGAKGRRKKKPAVKFGKIHVYERELKEGVARIAGGEGEVEVLFDDPDDEERVEIEVTGTEEGSLLVFNLAGFPRWELTHNGEPVEWFEVPATGKGERATQEDRKAGLWRQGTPGAHQGRSPILLAAEAADGTWVLRYNHWKPIDTIALVALILSLLLFILAFVPKVSVLVGRTQHRVEVILRDRRIVAILGVVAFAVPASRYVRGYAEEADLGVGWLRRGKVADVYGVAIEPLKVRRVIGPAIVVEREDKLDGPAMVTFTRVPVRPSIPGWYAVHDAHMDKKYKGRYTLTILVRPTGSDEDWAQVERISVKKTSGRKDFEVDLEEWSEVDEVDIAIEVDVKGTKPPMMGFDLDFDAEVESEDDAEVDAEE